MPGYANPQNLNRYSYVNNSPLMYTDPTGHQRVNEGDEDGSDDGNYQPEPDPEPDPPSTTPPTVTTPSDDYCATHPGACGGFPPSVGVPPAFTPPPSETPSAPDYKKAIGGVLLIGMGWFVAGCGGIITILLLPTLPLAAAETVVVPPVGLAHFGLAIVVGGGMITMGAIIAFTGAKAVKESGIIPTFSQ